MSDPLVSVVIPFLNAADTLAESLESILGQSFVDFEVVLFDDGSTDAGVGIAEAYAARHPRVRVMRSEHVGIVEALRRGCGEARGRYIARMDADDVAHGDRLGKQVAMLEGDEGIALCGTQVVSVGTDAGSGRARYDDWINGLLTHEDMERELYVECPIAHPTLMIRREAFEAVGGYVDRGWAEDYDLVLRCFGAGYRAGKVAEPLLQWRHSGSRLSMRDGRYSAEQFRAVKRHYLGSMYLEGREKFYQWGAGEVGKDWWLEWEGAGPMAVVDVNPRKFGKVIHGAKVIEAKDLPGPGEAFTVVAVGAPGAREEIREWFETRGYRELKDFLFIA